MLLHATISTNPISIIIWLALTISSTTICLAWQFTGSSFETEIKKQIKQLQTHGTQIEQHLATKTIHTAIIQYIERQQHPIIPSYFLSKGEIK